MQNTDIAQVEKDIRRYWYSDGISELIGGMMFIVLGLYFGVQDFLVSGSPLRIVLRAGLMVFLIAAIFVSRWLANTLKEKLTYPRTGYVAYKVDKKKIRRWRIVAIFVAALVGALAAILSNWQGSFYWIPALTGLLVGLILVFLRARETGLNRFYLLAAISLVLGLLLTLSGLPEALSLGSYYFLMGTCLLGTGLCVMRQYLGEHSLPQENPDE